MGERETRLPDAVYNRLYGTNPKTIARLVKELGTNHVYNHENRLDKSVVANLLARSKLKEYLPATYGYSWDNLKMLLDNQSRVVLKPVYGHYGLDIILIEQGKMAGRSLSKHFAVLDSVLTDSRAYELGQRN